MTKCVPKVFAKTNFRVNPISPAAIDTEMINRFSGKEGVARDAPITLHPVSSLVNSEEFAAAMLYLCSDAAMFTTRTSLEVNGGWLAQ